MISNMHRNHQMCTKYILTLIIFVLQTINLQAQHYVYSVTIGTSWARQVFPDQERAQRKKLEAHPFVIKGAQCFSKTFLDFEYDFKRYNAYNDSIFLPMQQEDWIDMFKRRAVKYSELYGKNNANLSIVKDFFADRDVPEAAYDSLYYWTRHLVFRNTNDMFLYETLLDILMPHYEDTQDIEHLMFCYLCSGMTNYQFSRMGDKEAKMRSELYFHKMMNQADRFAKFKDPLNRYYLISAFVNLVILHAEAGNIPLKECLNMSKTMERIYAQPESQAILQKDSLLNEYAKWSINVFRYRGIFSYISQGHNIPELRDELYKEYCDVRRERGITGHLRNRYYAKVDYDDLLVEAYMGNITWDEAFNRFQDKLANETDFTNKSGVPKNKINYMYNLTESYVTLLENTSFPQEKKGKIIKEYFHSLLDIFSRYEHSKYPFEKGKILSTIATNPRLLKYLNAEEKSDLLFQLIVVEQPITYVHVSMVAELAKILGEAMIDSDPNYFVGVPGYEKVADVMEKKEELIDLIYKSALYHDLGKISMPMVINNSFRKLTDHEFQIIQLHPEKSRQFFAIDPSLQPYLDVALGHHKWYDGDGYPASFKNRRSPYFPIICLVTLCDCMDAATENIGRNYHTPRSFERVMGEINDLIGEQFHPKLVNFINTEPQLYAKLKAVVRDGRYDKYYTLYKRYMSDKKPVKTTKKE